MSKSIKFLFFLQIVFVFLCIFSAMSIFAFADTSEVFECPYCHFSGVLSEGDVEYRHETISGVFYHSEYTNLICTNCSRSVSTELTRKVSADYVDLERTYYTCDTNDSIHNFCTAIYHCCSICAELVSTELKSSTPIETTTVTDNSTFNHLVIDGVHYNRYTRDVVCSHCFSVLSTSGYNDVPSTSSVDGFVDTADIVFYDDVEDVYYRIKTYSCDDCGQAVNEVRENLDARADELLLVATNDYGERSTNISKVIMGNTKTSYPLSSTNLNVISDAKKRAGLARYDYYYLFTPLGDRYLIDYYIYGSKVEFSAQVGLPCTVISINSTSEVVSVANLGDVKSCPMYQFYFKDGSYYINGEKLPVSSVFNNVGYTCYKYSWQYLRYFDLTQLNVDYFGSHLSFCDMYFADTDKDGKYDYTFIDPAVVVSPASVSETIVFSDKGLASVPSSGFTTDWLTSKYYPYTCSGTPVVGKSYIVRARMLMSTTTQIAYESVHLYMLDVPVRSNKLLVKTNVDFATLSKNYVIKDGDISVYTIHGLVQRFIPFELLEILNHGDGNVTVSFDGLSAKLQLLGLSDFGNGYNDGYIQGLIATNPIMGLVEGTWFVIKDGALTILNGISIGGFTLMSIVISLLIILLVSWVITKFTK